jgi:dipeptidyl aminopeptidase/acylaminoacyl peptidase
MTRSTFPVIATITVVLAMTLGLHAQRETGSMKQQVSYRTVTVEGISIFYREVGPKGAPTILLLHGLPSSSRMFQPLLTRLADKYHLVAQVRSFAIPAMCCIPPLLLIALFCRP